MCHDWSMNNLHDVFFFQFKLNDTMCLIGGTFIRYIRRQLKMLFKYHSFHLKIYHFFLPTLVYFVCFKLKNYAHNMIYTFLIVNLSHFISIKIVFSELTKIEKREN